MVLFGSSVVFQKTDRSLCSPVLWLTWGQVDVVIFNFRGTISLRRCQPTKAISRVVALWWSNISFKAMLSFLSLVRACGRSFVDQVFTYSVLIGQLYWHVAAILARNEVVRFLSDVLAHVGPSSHFVSPDVFFHFSCFLRFDSQRMSSCRVGGVKNRPATFKVKSFWSCSEGPHLKQGRRAGRHREVGDKIIV